MRYVILSTLALTLQATAADEYTVEPKPFKIETTLEAVFLPADSHAIRIAPDAWTDFTITSLVEHGAKVRKGDPLIGIDTRELDKDIADKESSIALSKLKLAQTRHELEQLNITTPRSLENHARSEREAAEELEHYTSTEHALEIEQAKRSVTSAAFYLSAQQEELQQLLKMYNEDSKTEETEEIILRRARHYVDNAAFRLRSAQINSDLQLGTVIPRKLKSLQRSAEDARISNDDARQKLPRALEIKQQEVQKASGDLEKEVEKLAELKADRAMMNITAPADGMVYYGEIEAGKWVAGPAAKALKPGKKLPAHTTLMSLIPSGTPLQLYAAAAEKNRGPLTEGASGYALTQLNPYQSFPVKISSIASVPDTAGSFPAILKPELPQGRTLAPGMQATARIITHKTDQALVVPTDYLSNGSDGGFTLKVKLADGKTADRKVTVGASNDKVAVITAGLEKDQVIVKQDGAPKPSPAAPK